MIIKLGDLVIFKKSLYPEEETTVYKVLELNGDRVLLELVNSSLLIRPQSVAMLNELEPLADEQSNLKD